MTEKEIQILLAFIENWWWICFRPDIESSYSFPIPSHYHADGIQGFLIVSFVFEFLTLGCNCVFEQFIKCMKD